MQRIILFLIGCIGMRISIGLFIKSNMCKGMIANILSAILAIIGCGFLIIFFGGLRKTGIETGGKPIWWNHLRPLHGLFYLTSAWLLFSGIRENKLIAGNIIIVDAIIGLIMWGLFHYNKFLKR